MLVNIRIAVVSSFSPIGIVIHIKPSFSKGFPCSVKTLRRGGAILFPRPNSIILESVIGGRYEMSGI
jgi:hypothetical protein